MSRAPAIDPRPHLAAVAAVATMPGQPDALFGALNGGLGAVLGHRLFTLMRYHDASGDSERIYTTHPAQYPVGGRKPLARPGHGAAEARLDRHDARRRGRVLAARVYVLAVHRVVQPDRPARDDAAAGHEPGRTPVGRAVRRPLRRRGHAIPPRR